MLVYGRKSDAVEALTSNEQFIQEVDYKVLRQNPQNPKGGRPADIYMLSVSCLEYFIVRKVRSVFEVYRQVFHKVTQSTFYVPQSFSEALLLAAHQQEMIESQQKQITELNTAVTQMQHKLSYADTILSSKDTACVTQIAQDYGMSAKSFNILLRNMGIQHKVGGAWVMYAKYLQEGYVQSETFTYQRKDGTSGARMNTKWTQRGRLFLYETLKGHNVLPLIERAATTASK